MIFRQDCVLGQWFQVFYTRLKGMHKEKVYHILCVFR